jgi:type IV fimbrial biogenesis protein FimT
MAARSTSGGRRLRGFTLTEAVVALAIFGFLIGLGVPAYGEFIRYYRLRSEAQAFAWALQLARSEAIKRNTRVNVCKTVDRVTCSKTGGFEAGWLIHPDPGATGQPDDDDPPIRAEPAAPDGITIRGNKPVADLVSYTPYGHPRLLNGGLQMGTFTLCLAGFNAVQVVLANSGRIRIENTTDPC